VRRALAAAQASLHAGIFEGALELLALVEASTPDELQMAHVELVPSSRWCKSRRA
jgi:hypothetical protein